jgi:hypothetical protein
VQRRPSAQESDADALRKAWARFDERVRRSLNMDLPTVRRLVEVADIAEAIIKPLLPDDEDNRWDVIGADYQLQSDIETFELLSGKAIRPEDALGDKIEMEDIEPSL